MRTLLLSSVVLLAVCGVGRAESVVLKGAAAEKFISEYLPGADIPGPVKGIVACDVPAMGAQSDGEVSTCSIRLR